MNVLIIEDEKMLALEIGDFLEKEGYLCEWAKTCEKASEKIYVNNYDFILLDLGLPDGDGFDLLKELKALDQREDAVIILTARGAVEDRIRGLDLGADDYLAKPFSLLELSARMQAIKRRRYKISRNEFDIHGFSIDLHNKEVRFHTEKVALTPKEFEIFHYLVLNKNRVISRLQLTEHIWGDVLEINSDSNFVDVHVKNLRKKLAACAPTDWFETIRSVGYKINVA